MKIGLAFNLKREPEEGEPMDKYAEFDSMSTVNAIKSALESRGHSVVLLEADWRFPQTINEVKVDFVFNIAEGIKGSARESYVPVILDALGIPYTGSDGVTLAITLDKRITSEVLAYHNIPVPEHWVCYDAENIPETVFPVVVKPNCEGSSKGIRNNSVVMNREELKKMVRSVISTYKQPALIQRYLPGREFTVSIVGNGIPKVLPIVEITFDDLPEGMAPIDSYEVKWIWDNPENPLDPVVCPAKIDSGLEESIRDVALRSYAALGCRDMCRIDLRLDEKGIPNVIDVNALPGLIPDPKENSRFPKAAYTAGYSYEELINEILEHALRRTGRLEVIRSRE